MSVISLMQQFIFQPTSLSTGYFFIFTCLIGLWKLELIKFLEVSCQTVLQDRSNSFKIFAEKEFKSRYSHNKQTAYSLLHLPDRVGHYLQTRYNPIS